MDGIIKALLFSGVFLVESNFSAAQTMRAHNMHGILYPKAKPAPIDMNDNGANQRINSNNSVQAQTLIMSSRNGFGTLVEATSPIQYNADLNMIAFTHRLPTAADWPTTGLPSGAGLNGY